MNPFWDIVLIFSIVLFFLAGICNCRSCLKEYRIVQNLIHPEEPVIIVNDDNVFTMPVTDGVRVYTVNETITIIDAE